MDVAYIFTHIGVATALLLLVGATLFFVAKNIAPMLKSVNRSKAINISAFVISAIILTIFAGRATSVTFSFVPTSGLVDFGSSYDPSTGVATARWIYNNAVADFKFKWYYTYKYGSESKGPFQLPDANVKDATASVVLNLDDDGGAVTITCYTVYVRPEVVTTNGVYHLDGVGRTLDTKEPGYLGQPKFVTPSIPIVVDFGKILTPTSGVSQASVTSDGEDNE